MFAHTERPTFQRERELQREIARKGGEERGRERELGRELGGRESLQTDERNREKAWR